MTNRFDVTPFLKQEEGQHFERKSLFEGEPGHKRPRDRRTVRDDIAKYVAAFANAEGGLLILGIEDDSTLTGHRYPPAVVQTILTTPQTRLSPPQRAGFTVTIDDHELLVFEIDIADVAVHVTGDGFPLRIGDATHQVSESKIQALKLAGLVESWESRPSPMQLADLDPTLLARARKGAGLDALTDEEYLLRRKLADRRGHALVIRRAAELLFAKHGPDHANAGVRVFRVIGTERRTGAEHNVEERPRIEGPLPAVLDEATKLIGGLLRRPSRLVGTRFRETPEYPEFTWKEALLNAIAHRDYSIEGRSVEVWLFEDRMEIRSPGGLVPQVSLEDLTSLARQHVSRNPRLVRVLVDLGYMRDQGEGIPRIFAEMEGLFLPAPTLEADGREFRLRLRNTPSFTASDRAFVASIGSEDVTDHEFRALIEAHRHGRVDNARMRAITGLDTLNTSHVLRRLRDRGLLNLRGAGSQSYYELGQPDAAVLAPITYEQTDRGAFEGTSETDRGGLGVDRGGLGVDRGGLEHAPERDEETGRATSNVSDLPVVLQTLVSQLGERPRQERLREVILRLTQYAELTPLELAALLGHRDVKKLVERHLGPMVEEGKLQRTHADTPSHPGQRYRARQFGLSIADS